MTIGKASVFALSLAAAMGFGIWASPYVMPHISGRAQVIDQRDRTEASPTAKAAARVRPTSRLAHAPADRILTRTVAVDSPALYAQLKPLLNKGTDVTLAAERFATAEQFASVARAARNTGIPFVLLKHRVLVEGMSLADAIRASKPNMNSAVEAQRAVAEAQSDIATVAG